MIWFSEKNIEFVALHIVGHSGLVVDQEIALNASIEVVFDIFQATSALGGSHTISATHDKQCITRVGYLNIPGYGSRKAILVGARHKDIKLELAFKMRALRDSEELGSAIFIVASFIETEPKPRLAVLRSGVRNDRGNGERC